MTNANKPVSRTFSCAALNPGARLRLFCFPYAGGSDFIFRKWSDRLPISIEVWAANLPGRGRRFNERPYTSLAPLVDALANAITEYLDRPFAFFGHSMGATVAFELAQVLRAKHDTEPSRLLVSARSAPHIPERKPPTYALPDDKFIDELRRLNGTPKEVLDSTEFVEFILPVLRADSELIQTYRYEQKPPLDCPITAFGGLEDAEVPLEDLRGWSEHTKGAFALKTFPGDHFFLHAFQRELLDEVSIALAL